MNDFSVDVKTRHHTASFLPSSLPSHAESSSSSSSATRRSWLEQYAAAVAQRPPAPIASPPYPRFAILLPSLSCRPLNLNPLASLSCTPAALCCAWRTYPILSSPASALPRSPFLPRTQACSSSPFPPRLHPRSPRRVSTWG